MYYGVGFTHSDLYSMPIYLRNFYYNELVDSKKKEHEQIKQSQQKSKSQFTPSNPRFKR